MSTAGAGSAVGVCAAAAHVLGTFPPSRLACIYVQHRDILDESEESGSGGRQSASCILRRRQRQRERQRQRVRLGSRANVITVGLCARLHDDQQLEGGARLFQHIKGGVELESGGVYLVSAAAAAGYLLCRLGHTSEGIRRERTRTDENSSTAASLVELVADDHPGASLVEADKLMKTVKSLTKKMAGKSLPIEVSRFAFPPHVQPIPSPYEDLRVFRGQKSHLPVSRPHVRAVTSRSV